MANWTGSGARSTDTATGRQIWLDWQVDTTDGSTWQLQIWVNTGGQSVDSSNSFTISGTWSRGGSVSINTPSGGGRQQIYNSTVSGGNPASFSSSLSQVTVVTGRNYPACSISTQTLTYSSPPPPPGPPPPTIYAPSAPQSFAANTSTFGQIGLSWSAPSSNGGSAVTSYVLRNGATVLQNSGATSYTHTGLSPYTDYSYTVTAANSVGEGAAASLTAKTMGGICKVWNGSAWVVALPKIWNGTSWVDAQARIWDGSQWKYGI
jgi:hypothetical protein